MEKFQEGEYTQLVFERILEIDQTLAEELPGIEEMELLDPAKLFREGINNRLVKLGFDGDMESVNCKIDFLCKQFQKNKVELRNDATLKSWMTGSAPASDKNGRENVFRLCFALEMNAEETAEFFLKAFLSRPYNYKKINEAVYYFCLLKGRNYVDAVQIIADIHNIPQSRAVEKEMNTEQIGYEISNINDETELIKYLAENRYSEEEQHYTSVKRIRSMLDSCFELAQKETQLTRGTSVTVKSVDALLDVIYDYDADSIYKNEKKTLKKHSKLPKCVKANWIDRQALHNIEKHITSTDDVYRKALILLKFYSYYADAYCKARAKIREDEIDFRGYADDFEAELETVLAECGYIQLYKRNPFDWMILYCAASLNPLSTFRDIISKYFLDVVKDE